MAANSNIRIANALVRLARELIELDDPRNSTATLVMMGLDAIKYFKDKEGRMIFKHWLNAEGDWTNAPFGEYLKKNKSLKTLVDSYIIFTLIPELIKSGKNEKSFNRHIPIELDDNGYTTGYGLLHGTESTAGGFHLHGTLTKVTNNEIDGDFKFYWKDKIDPNPKYVLDIITSYGLNIVTLGKPKNYTIRIPFDSQFKAIKNKNHWILTGGFPAND